MDKKNNKSNKKVALTNNKEVNTSLEQVNSEETVLKAPLKEQSKPKTKIKTYRICTKKPINLYADTTQKEVIGTLNHGSIVTSDGLFEKDLAKVKTNDTIEEKAGWVDKNRLLLISTED